MKQSWKSCLIHLGCKMAWQSARWRFTALKFDEQLTPQQKAFAFLIMVGLKMLDDPREYKEHGVVEPLEDYRRFGGRNLVGAYKVKPYPHYRANGLDIRVVFQLLIHNKVVYQQHKITHPNANNCDLVILYVGPRTVATYEQVATVLQAHQPKTGKHRR